MKIDTNDMCAVLLIANYVDAVRSLSIFDTPMARLRPGYAWAVLPLGHDVETSLELIDKCHPMQNPPRAFHAKHLELLTMRRDAALFAWRAYTNGERRDGQSLN